MVGLLLTVPSDPAHDGQRLATLRETIRDRIIEYGLDIGETPTFIRERISREGGTGEETLDRAEGRGNLDELERSLAGCKQGLFAVAQAMLARVFASSHGDFGEAERLLTFPRGGLKSYAQAWFDVYGYHACKTGLPDLARLYRDRFDAYLKEAQNTKSLRDSDDALAEREDWDDPSQILSAASLARLYPRGGNFDKGPIRNVLRQVKQARATDDAATAIGAVSAFLRTPNRKALSDEAQAPQLADAIADVVRQLKSMPEAAELIRLFANFAGKMPEIVKTADPFYETVLRANLARGLAAIDANEAAMQQLRAGLESLGRCGNFIDFIDAAVATLNAIEMLALVDRRDMLTAVASRFQNLTLLNGGRMFGIAVGFLDQLVETGTSTTKLSLSLYKDYQHADEYLILHRILNDNPCLYHDAIQP